MKRTRLSWRTSPPSPLNHRKKKYTLHPPMTALLWICDVQPRLVAGLSNGSLLKTSLLKLLNELADCDVVVTEQMPAKLGHTDPDILAALSAPTVVAKTCFSGWPSLKPKVEANKFDYLIITGAETHICIIKTLRDMALCPAGQRVTKVLLVDQCVDSMSALDRAVALEEIRRTYGARVELVPVDEVKRKLSVQPEPVTGGLKLYLGDDVRSSDFTFHLDPTRTMTPLLEEVARLLGLEELQKTNEQVILGKGSICVTNFVTQHSSAHTIVVEKLDDANLIKSQHVMTIESLIFSLLNSSDDPKFKELLRIVKAAKSLAASQYPK
eukprot:Blabericola_migrator_1__6560@NODE_3305_length_1877_cov_112_271271_g2066_i0_p1_GENE_NODE_3305_length_1877_cov_112_271271_g2066_i0NODE_3305_length_1877_cov_112_271271_g2066_i0_p1_ORF_typecomplete_len325_score37_27Isochorismatase/PF00857_20/2_3e11_NODE_3305_length_1877_cov_112_271271_g2066_i08491823